MTAHRHAHGDDEGQPTPKPPAGLIVVGLTGGIGAGKSTVARAFARAGAAVSDSDATAREILQHPAVRDELVQWWGAQVLDEAGSIDRAKVAAQVFADPSKRARLEGLVHPLIHARRAQEMDAARAAGKKVFVIDAPLLLEAGLGPQCHAVVYIDAPRHVRLARVQHKRGWTEAEFDRREAAQWPLDRKRAAARFVIENSGSGGEGEPAPDADLDGQVHRVIQTLLAGGA